MDRKGEEAGWRWRECTTLCPGSRLSLAPLALGYFFGSGLGGFPRDAALALRAEVETACGASAFAAACQGIAQEIAREAGAAERFAAAFAQLHADDQKDLRITIDGTLEEHPPSAPFKELKTIIDRIAPEKD